MLLLPLSDLPEEWFPHLCRILEPYIINDAIDAAHSRFRLIYEVIRILDYLQLGFNSTNADLSVSFRLLKDSEKEKFPTPADLAGYINGLYDLCFKHLFPGHIDQEPVSNDAITDDEEYRAQALAREHEQWLAENKRQEQRRAFEAQKRLDAHREELKSQLKSHHKIQKLHLYIPSQEPASQSCKTPQTIDLLSPEEIIEKFSEHYGEALRDENGHVITDITGLPRLKAPGTAKEPRLRRDFKPYYSPP